MEALPTAPARDNARPPVRFSSIGGGLFKNHARPALAEVARPITYWGDLLRQTDDPLGFGEAERMIRVRRYAVSMAMAMADELAVHPALCEPKGYRVVRPPWQA